MPAVTSASEVKITLGSVIVRSAGDSFYMPAPIVRSVPLNVELWFYPSEIERDGLGKIEFAYMGLWAYFRPAHWINETDGMLYTDTGVQAGVQEFINALGYSARIEWSEAGRQTSKYCDFDVDYSIIDEILLRHETA